MRRLLALPVLLALLVAPSTARAAEGDPASGWWSQTKLGGTSPVEVPDDVPEGGLQVAGEPGGPVSVAAVRVEPAPGSRVSGLRLAVARATGDVQVQVCATAARWRPVDGDRLDAAPPADCAALSVTAQVSEGVLVVDLPAGAGGLPLDVRLQPVAGAVFALDLAPVTASSVRSEPVAATRPQAAPAPPQAPAADPGPALAPGSAPAPPPAGPLAAPEPLLAGEAPVPGTTTDQPLAVPPPELPAQAPPVPVLAAPVGPVAAGQPRPSGPDGRREQLAALALLAGLLALGVGLQRAPARAPQRLGGAARLAVGTGEGAVREGAAAPVEAVRPERGVGRFRGPRDRPPVAL